MLDIRATHYVSPLAEVPFTDVALTVHVVNVADETGLISGLFRVYNDTTHELIFSSEIAPFSLSAGQTVDLSALTDFSPPAPLDDTYFVLFTGHACDDLVPDGISFFLGAFHFDVKAGPLGDPPEAHAPTHEQGGADPIETADLGTSELDTALRLAPDGAGGVVWDTAAPGGVPAHAASHESGGADEIEPADLATSEMDDTLVLAPDGAGGVEFRAEAGGVTDHGALTGLADDDHTQYRLRHEVRYENEFLRTATVPITVPWRGAAISGTLSAIAGEPSHPGILEIVSAASANSGAYLLIDVAAIRLSGGETSSCWHRPQTLADTTRHHGFHDSTNQNDPVDGAWIWQDPTTGIIYGRTRSNSVGSITGTGYQLVTNTWYFEKVIVNADATRVDYYCYSAAGAELWHDFLTTNIPTAAGRELGHGIVATNSGSSAVALDDVDYLAILIPDTRPL